MHQQATVTFTRYSLLYIGATTQGAGHCCLCLIPVTDQSVKRALYQQNEAVF
jgi:hypothetical protein